MNADVLTTRVRHPNSLTETRFATSECGGVRGSGHSLSVASKDSTRTQMVRERQVCFIERKRAQRCANSRPLLNSRQTLPRDYFPAARNPLRMANSR
jgi:hypothetical protein